MNILLASLPKAPMSVGTDLANNPQQQRRSPSPAVPREAPPQVLWTENLRLAAGSHGRWLWYGYLSPGNLTLLTSQWKAGKTTLVSVLLARLKEGGTLASLALSPGKAVVVSEEDAALWYVRSQQLNFGNHLCWMCRPFNRKPTLQQWLDLIDQLAELHWRHTLDLVIIDPLASFLPVRSENAADAMLEALLPLQQLTRLGLSILLLHHPPKKVCSPGQGSRGSGALPSHVDIVIEMRRRGRPAADNRRRRLLGFSRYQETPREHVIELAPDGADYLSLGNGDRESFLDHWDTFKTVLDDAQQKLTRQEILQQWPADFPKPNIGTLHRWLQSAVPLGRICQQGTGRRRDPFRYWLPERTDDFSTEGASAEEMADTHRSLLF
jgi:hypothetical protein